MLDVCLSSFLFVSPPRHQLVLYPEMVEDPGHYGIHDLLNTLRTGVERRVGRQDRCTRLEEELEVPYVDQVEGSLARDMAYSMSKTVTAVAVLQLAKHTRFGGGRD